MTDVYVIRNQLGHYWGKSKEWVDGTEPKAILRVKHEDEAVNTLFELSSRDFDLRGAVISASLTEKGEPDVEPSEHLLPKETPQRDDAEGEQAATAESTTDVPEGETAETP